MEPLFSTEYYWERPITISKTDSRFPITITNGKDSYVFWEEVDTEKNEIYLTGRLYNSVTNYKELKKIAGPFYYSGNEVPDIYTAAISKDGTVSLAVLADSSQISIFTTKDKGEKFYETKLKTKGMMVAPRIYTTKDGKFKLFTSVGESEAFSIYTADSDNGLFWPNFYQFRPTSSYRNPFIPVLGSVNGKDIVVFQAQYTIPESNRTSYQLFLTYENGNKWTDPILLTDDKSLSGRDSNVFYKYQNQKPNLYNFNGHMYMAWERTGAVNSDIWVAEIDENGMKEYTAEQISSGGNASRAVLFSYDGKLYCNWFDTRSGRESIYMAEKTGSYWEESTLVENNNTNLFAYPFVLKQSGKDVLTFVWQQITRNNKNTIGMLTPDIYAAPPTLKPITFREGKHSKAEDVAVQIIFPEDSSDIAGYSYTWSKDSPKRPESELQYLTGRPKIKTVADEEGEYFLSVRVRDYAGNWSEPAEISYYRDLTPPTAPEINITNVDEYGFLVSNNFNLQWEPSSSGDAVSYIYEIKPLGDIPNSLKVSSRHPLNLASEDAVSAKEKIVEKYEEEAQKKSGIRKGIKTSNLMTSRYYNYDNGVYLLSVAAVDEVGNVSEPNTELFVLNKYEPSTYITSVEHIRTEVGDTVLTIYGGGFTYDGTISEIYVDSDGRAPYDFVLKKSKNDFKVVSDRKIINANVGPDIDEGKYKIGLRHTDRGLYFSEKNNLTVDQNGTIKIEAEYVKPKGITSAFTHFKYIISHNTVVLILLIILILLVISFIVISIRHSIHESRLNNLEVKSLMRGEKMPLLKKNKIKGKHLPSLKGKLIRFTFAIIIVVVTVVTVQNGYKSIQLQAQTMASGLLNRTEVLLESLNSGVKNFFPAGNILELSALPKQKDAMDEVNYVTIIGQKLDSQSAENLNYIWASNDSGINQKTDDYEISYGSSEISDEVIRNVTGKFVELDKEIAAKEKDLSNQIKSLEEKAENLYKTGFAEDDKEADRISEIIAELRNKLDADLAEFSKNAMGSYPFFDVDNMDFENTDYIFYRPVMYRKGTSDNYIHSVVYLELSTKTLIDSVNSEMTRILILGIVIASIAVALGIIGSYVFASLIVRPIKKLEAHVTMIGQTKNKANLKGKDVKIKSKDEVGRLGDAINVMTRELVLNAEEEELAMDGKAVQKAFLPLADSALNTKNTIAEYEDDNLNIYGYYEGESGVSGDYFDYKKLDEQWFGIIKCDASGHGIPAAIIMTVVATIFRRYFENWSYKKNGTKLNTLVEQINDFIEGLGLKGKFATLIICLLNVKTGELYMCNAGDNLVHIFDGATRKMKVITLQSVPTAGVFTSDLVAMRGGFKVEKTILNKGDTLFLYTDGIEESTRRIREPDFSVRQNEVEVRKFNPKTKQEEVTSKFEDAKEEFGPERVAEIIESVYNKQKYILTKEDNPNESETLEFNFEKCEGTVKDTILALASLEKVYRLYKSDDVQATDYIKIDKKIDEFLSKYFNMYEYYAANKTEATELSNYIDYDLMLEDEQSDDLTLLAIKRK